MVIASTLSTTRLVPRHDSLPGPVLLAFLLLLLLLAPAGAARAEESCRPEFRAGSYVWYAVETEPRVRKILASNCATATGRQPDVLFFVKGTREFIACDLELSLPDGMLAELDAAQLQGANALPSTRATPAMTWRELVGKHSALLRCAAGSRRMSDASSGVPSVWCRRELTASELCPTGTTFASGACFSVACPDGMTDLDRASGGKLVGCFRCPAGRLDLEESISWQEQAALPSSRQGQITAILCKARATEPCPGAGMTAPDPVVPAGARQ